MQKEVKINGLKFNHQFGIIQVSELEFDEKIRMYVTKGKAGHGKSTITKALQLGTQGSKTLTDNKLYGDIDLEVQLTDGDLPLWIGCKSSDKALSYVLYTKDANGKKVKDPVIDGVKATPANYLAALQTELTWRMDELTSENPSVQKKILLKLYQQGLKKIGIIFDKKHPDYKDSILGQIDAAVSDRDMADMIRKQHGGIAADLIAKGIDPDRPETCPDEINIEEIEKNIKALEKEKTQKETNSESVKEKELAEIKSSVEEVKNRCLVYNNELKDLNTGKVAEFNNNTDTYTFINSHLIKIGESLEKLEIANWEKIHAEIEKKVVYPEEMDAPKTPEYIQFNEKNQVIFDNVDLLDEKGKMLTTQIEKLTDKYIAKLSEPKEFDSTKIDETILQLFLSKSQAVANNKIVKAIDTFHKYRGTKEAVVELKKKYIKLLAQVDTGVEGLAIVPVEDEIFLMYDGSYDPSYFGNPKKEMRKVSSYSGTQKPVLCLLIQNYLLSKKEKVMRYLHIDNVPIDITSKNILEKMSIDLNIHIFLNMTGDYDKEALNSGEILVEGGQVFFND